MRKTVGKGAYEMAQVSKETRSGWLHRETVNWMSGVVYHYSTLVTLWKSRKRFMARSPSRSAPPSMPRPKRCGFGNTINNAVTAIDAR